MSVHRPQTELRNVLIISYYFPPSGGPGVQRVLKFARYLPRFGYRPLILTVPESAAFPTRDPSLLDEIPAEAKVYRAPLLELYDAYRWIARSRPSAPVNLNLVVPEGETRRARLLRTLRGMIFIPDGRVGWLPAGTDTGRRICREEKVDLIFASGPPFTAHWIARRIARSTGLPLVLDFRDPWIGAPFHAPRPALARRLDERLERSCVLSSSRIVTINDDIRMDLLARYPEMRREQIEMITNGFDPEDFAGRRRNPAPVWTLAFTGTVPVTPVLSSLLPALEELAREEPGLINEMRLRIAGTVEPALADALRRHPIGPAISLEGYLPHGDAVQVLLDSHLLLLLIERTPRDKGSLSGKLFEYLGSRTPILGITPECEAADLVRATGCGRVVDSGDRVGEVNALREALHAFREGRRPFGEPKEEIVSSYERPELTRRLAALFDIVIKDAR